MTLRVGFLRKTTVLLAFLMSVDLLFIGNPVPAHNVTVFAWVEGETVHVESKFSGGRRPVDTPVEVYDTRGNLLLKGTTDGNGEFSFKAPKKAALKIVLPAGMGHKGEWTVPLSDLEDVNADTSSAVSAAGSQPPVAAAPGRNGNAASAASDLTGPTASASAGEIRAMVEEALDTKLKPIMKLLAEMHQKGPSVTEILGGVGYIFGLVGLAAYLSAKRRKS